MKIERNQTPVTLNRRQFVAGAAGLLASPTLLQKPVEDGAVTFGLIADLHHSFMPEAHLRLEAFLQAAQERKLDFLIQLGDLCHGYKPSLKPDQRAVLDMWNSVLLPKFDVLGNHEMDECSKRCIMDYLHMDKPYYSFDRGDVHFVVLDCMHVLKDGQYVDYENGNYYRFEDSQINWVDPTQREWLIDDLRKTALPTVVFTHPCIHPYWGGNSAMNEGGVRDVFAKANAEAGWQKVAACLSGHEHANEHAVANGTHYVLINSASYYYVGEHYGELAKYRDPLFCFITVHPGGTITIEGRHSEFVPPTPTQLKFPEAKHLSASIDSRKLSFAVKSASADSALTHRPI